MKRLLVIAAAVSTAAPVFVAPQLASAQSVRDYGSGDICRAEQRRSATTGAVIGGAAGAVVGRSVAADNARTEGALLGAAVGAVAFFAAWSVLSNIFCTLLIVTTRPFRLHDQIELLESGDKPGLKGQVIDVNVIYTTLKESRADGEAASVLQIPNSLFFQRILRRWER